MQQIRLFESQICLIRIIWIGLTLSRRGHVDVSIEAAPFSDLIWKSVVDIICVWSVEALTSRFSY